MNSRDLIISYWDWLLCPFYLLVIFIVASRIKNKNIVTNRIYRYFLWGLLVKIFGAICLCVIYVYYYKEGGDTLVYHSSSCCFVNLLFHDSYAFFKVWLGEITEEKYSFFNNETGYPIFYFQSYEAFVSKLLVPLELLSFKKYVLVSILMAVVSYSGIWRLYIMFCEVYPPLYKKFSIAILFIPSVVFWGSGVLKDSWTIAATGWFSYSFYNILIVRRNIVYNSITIILSSIILISIKPYIFVALFPGCLVWGMWSRIVNVKNYVLRFLFIPFVVVLGIAAGAIIFTFFSDSFGAYGTLDGMLKKAQITSDDLKQQYYQGNSFDIGTFEPTLAGVMVKFPIASMTGLFRPFLWEARNVVMILSGFENFILLLFFIHVFLKWPVSNMKSLFSKPVVLFSVIFALFFAFSVAISTSNFGALVRLRIPMLPFFVAALVILKHDKDKFMLTSGTISSS